MCMDVRPSFGAQVASQKVHPWRKWTLPTCSSNQLPIAPQLWVRLHEPLPYPWCDFCACSHNYCEFMCRSTITSGKYCFSGDSFYLWLLQSFFAHFSDDPWALDRRCNIDVPFTFTIEHSTVSCSLHTAQPRVCVFESTIKRSASAED